MHSERAQLPVRFVYTVARPNHSPSLQDSDVAIGAFQAQQPGGVKPVAEVIPYEDTKLIDADKFLAAFDHTSNMTYIIVSPSNASQPFLAIWPGYGPDVHIVPHLDA